MLVPSPASNINVAAVDYYPDLSLSAMKETSINGFHTPSYLGTTPNEDFNSIQRLIQHAFRSSRILVHQIEVLEDHLYPIELVRLSDGSRLVLKTSPRPSVRLLRHEKHGLDAEARVLSNLNRYKELPTPHLIKFEPPGGVNPLDSAVLLTSFSNGFSLANMQAYLTAQDRQSIDRQLGIFAYIISSQVSPFFGTITGVSSGSGSRSWRETFLSLLESVLRDGEDMLIQLPYEQIRTHMNRLTPCLEDVNEARLVVPKFGMSSNVIIDPDTRQVSGLVDFTEALWGDILMAEIFEHPSIAFLEGFGSNAGSSGRERLRMLLYACYRSIVTIVTHYYRNRNDDGELHARMALTRSLTDMALTEY